MGMGLIIGGVAVSLQTQSHIGGTLKENSLFLPPLHTLVWPGAKIPETANEKLERLEVPVLDGSKSIEENSIPPNAAEKPVLSEVKPVLTKVGEVKNNTINKQTKRHRRHTGDSANASIQKEITPEQAVENAPKPKPLDLIRSDAERIYVEDSLHVGQLTFGVRNISPRYGIEVWVAGDEYFSGTIYYPSARVGHIKAAFEGQMVSGGQKFYGSIPVSDLKGKKYIDIFFSAAGIPEKKVTVKLEW